MKLFIINGPNLNMLGIRETDIYGKMTYDALVTKIECYAKEKGVAVIFVGEDLDVLLELCDRILVICSGRITGVVDARNPTKEEIGLLMTKTTAIEDGGESHG